MTLCRSLSGKPDVACIALSKRIIDRGVSEFVRNEQCREPPFAGSSVSICCFVLAWRSHVMLT
jgi:hypothetical protein